MEVKMKTTVAKERTRAINGKKECLGCREAEMV